MEMKPSVRQKNDGESEKNEQNNNGESEKNRRKFINKRRKVKRKESQVEIETQIQIEVDGKLRRRGGSSYRAEDIDRDKLGLTRRGSRRLMMRDQSEIKAEEEEEERQQNAVAAGVEINSDNLRIAKRENEFKRSENGFFKASISERNLLTGQSRIDRVNGGNSFDQSANNNSNPSIKDAVKKTKAKTLPKAKRKRAKPSTPKVMIDTGKQSNTDQNQQPQEQHPDVKKILIHSTRNFEDIEGMQVFEQAHCPERRCEVTYDLR